MTAKKSISILFVEKRRIVKQVYHGKIKYYGKFQREIVRFAEGMSEKSLSNN